MINDLLFALWFFLPAGIANMIPIPVSKISFLRQFTYPIDFYQTFRGKRIFGDHKTIRGLFFACIAAILVSWVQTELYKNGFGKDFITIDYSSMNPIIFGILSAIGALGGDAIKSFFKRQIGVEPGKAWFPFDQIDYIVGGIICTAMYVPLALYHYLLIFVLYFGLHLLSTFIGFKLKLKDSPI
jgi:CDP-2,3-bis-(O-geranylgeranyl)-sn-glycerol synthase